MQEVTREYAEQVMSANGWLSYMPEPFRREIFEKAVVISYEPGQAIFRVGDRLGGMYGLVAGSVSINTASDSATPRLVHLGVAGAWTGEGPFLTGQPRRAELRALSAAWMMHIPLEAMEQMARKDSAFIRAVCVNTVLTVDVLVRIVHDLQKRNASRRIASVIHRTAWLGNESIPLSQHDLGIMANASRQQVNATLNKFSKNGWIEYNYRNIFIKNSKEISNHAEQED